MHRSFFFQASWLGVLIVLALSGLGVAQNAKMAITDIKEVDNDFALQGEYSGQVVENAASGVRSKKYGLQVVAQGGGQFRAVLYAGGLPGSGWDRQTKFSLTGQRAADAVEFSDDDFTVIVNEGQAKVASPEKQVVGQLEKVQRQSPTLGKRPPSNAVVLFDGKETEYLKGAKITEDGLLMEGAELTKLAQDFQLHLEFKLPYMPYARGQGRANSGVYLHKRYEVQVLDSFGLEGAANEAGSLYREHKPLVNMVLPPLSWQTYDIAFTAPRFDADGNKVKNARLTVLLNGVPVQKDLDLASATGGGKKVGEGPDPLPINLQNHGNPIRFRNIWMVDYTQPQSPSETQTETPIAQSESARISSGNVQAAGVPGIGFGPLPVWSSNRISSFIPDNTFPGGMVPAGVVPYYVPGYYANPLPAPVVWGW